MENHINDNNQTYINLKNNTSELRKALAKSTILRFWETAHLPLP